MILRFFSDACIENNIMPAYTRSDFGTENIDLAFIQQLYQGLDTHIFGPSPSNQRIERWWGSMRLGGVEKWIQFFREMELEGTTLLILILYYFNSHLQVYTITMMLIDSSRFGFHKNRMECTYDSKEW